jgi:pre-mRNA-processing factor 19
MSLFVCELSGETSSDGMVVTPSGHVCQRSLLLQKLTENGGIDPFDSSRSLSEDDVIDLKSKVVPPRAAGTSSMSSLLSLARDEYHAVLLELFDTRKLLEETRQELSQALYQNDAATRVVARLAMERDAALQQLEHISSSGVRTPSVNNQVIVDEEPASNATTESGEPPAKKAKVDEDQPLPLTNDIPEAHLQHMISTWEELHKNRKALQKERVSQCLPPDDMISNASTVAYHKTKCKGVVALASNRNHVVTAGTDKQVVIYDAEKKTVVQTIASKNAVVAVDLNSKFILVGSRGGVLTAYGIEDGAALGSITAPSHIKDAAIVGLHVHPDGIHCLSCFESGHLALFSLSSYETIAVFEDPASSTYTCGALHPDGLIYVCGTSKGDCKVWDLKAKGLAAIIPGEVQVPVTSLAISENGYHIAAALSSSGVALLDLRKTKQIGKVAGPCQSLAFDPSAKYLALGGVDGVRLVTVKDQAEAATLPFDKEATGLRWVQNKLLVVSGKERSVSLFG